MSFIYLKSFIKHLLVLFYDWNSKAGISKLIWLKLCVCFECFILTYKIQALRYYAFALDSITVLKIAANERVRQLVYLLYAGNYSYSERRIV